MTTTQVYLAVEDILSEIVMREAIKKSGRDFLVIKCHRKGGSGYLKKNIARFNQAASHIPFIVLTDLDRVECPLRLISDWLKYPQHPNLIFRVAVRETEAWLLAHREAFAQFLGVSQSLIPENVDAIEDPKQKIVALAKKSKKRSLYEALIPTSSTTKIGEGFNSVMLEFVKTAWQIEVATENSESLARACRAITNFKPQS